MAWAYHNPVAVSFGAGTFAELASIVADCRAVLVAFPEAAALGHAETHSFARRQRARRSRHATRSRTRAPRSRTRSRTR
jgi:hypothetical protein